MKANELRIGNWVANSEPQFTPFIQIKELSPIGHGMYSWIKPIPLTEEWLLKFGFKDESSYWSRPELKLARHKIYGGEMILTPNPLYACELKYVHELQNLYFALTGEELTLKS